MAAAETEHISETSSTHTRPDTRTDSSVSGQSAAERVTRLWCWEACVVWLL